MAPCRNDGMGHVAPTIPCLQGNATFNSGIAPCPGKETIRCWDLVTGITEVLFPGGRFLGIEWHIWKIVGWLGNAIFFSRFLVQWHATEKRRRVVIPSLFWWLSLIGSLLLLAYSLHRRDSVFVFAYAFSWIPYIRNLLIHHRHKSAELTCPLCEHRNPPDAAYCSGCGVQLSSAPVKSG